MQISDPEPRAFQPTFSSRGPRPVAPAWASNRPEEPGMTRWTARLLERRREPTAPS